MAKRRHKYNNKKRVYNGINFDSIKEMRRYKQLELLQMAGEISDLEVQPVFVLMKGFKFEGKNYPKISYKSDFRYKSKGVTIVEDVKSPITAKEPLYRVKMKLFVEQYIVPSEGKLKFFELN